MSENRHARTGAPKAAACSLIHSASPEEEFRNSSDNDESRFDNDGLRRSACGIALGARPSQVVWLVLRRVVMQVWMGIAVGVAGAFLVQRTLQSLLVQTNSADPLTFAVMALLLALVVINACIWRARRAAKLDPLTALRRE
jgi:hypothetical protein